MPPSETLMRRASMALALSLSLAIAPRVCAQSAVESGDAAPPADAAPADAAPTDAAPTDAAPTDAAPNDASPPDAAQAESLEDELDEFDEFDDVDEGDSPTTPAAATFAPALAAQVWILDDGIGPADDPWDDYDPNVSYSPRGEVHGGLQLRVAGLIDGAPPSLPGPLGELSGFLDVRYGATNPFHIRLAIAIAVQTPGAEYLGAGTSANSSPGSFRLRVYPLAFDIGHWAAFRLGGSLGVSLIEDPAQSSWDTEVFGGTTGELVLRLVDGMLEVGAFGGMQLTALSATSRVSHTTGVTTQGVLGATVAVVL